VRGCQHILADIREEEEALLPQCEREWAEREKALSLSTAVALQSSLQLRAEKAAVLQATQVNVHANQTSMLLTKPLCCSLNLYAAQVNVNAATEAQRLFDAHEVAHRAAVSLRQAQIHSATSHCASAQSSIEALTTREAALRSEVALLETEHAVKVEALEALLLEVRQERSVALRERSTFLDLLAARKILEEERAHLR
jgi:hypothetical protein